MLFGVFLLEKPNRPFWSQLTGRIRLAGQVILRGEDNGPQTNYHVDP